MTDPSRSKEMEGKLSTVALRAGLGEKSELLAQTLDARRSYIDRVEEGRGGERV